MIRGILREVRAVRRLGSQARVGPVLAPDQVRELLSKPSWSVAELLHDHKDRRVQVDRDHAIKALKMSGIEPRLTEEQQLKLKNALQAQISFIQYLYEDTNCVTSESNNDSHFRLLPSDHFHTTELDYDTLMDSIREVPSQVDAEKGEKGFDIAQLGKHKFFTFTAKK